METNTDSIATSMSPSHSDRPVWQWIQAGAWVLFLALAPVTWLPGVSPSVIDAVRWCSLAVAIVLTWMIARDRALPRGLAGPIGLLVVLVTSLFALLQATAWDAAVDRIVVTAGSFALLWTAFTAQRAWRGFPWVISVAGFVHGVLGLAILAVANTGVVVEIPAASPVSYPESFTLVDVGFSWSRTQWSGGVALFVPFVIAVVIGRSSAWIRVVAGAALVGTFAGQIITAGRSGIIVTLFAVVFMAASRWGWRGLLGSIVGTGAVMALVVSSNAERLRFDRLWDASEDALDFTSGRLELNRYALEQIGDDRSVATASAFP